MLISLLKARQKFVFHTVSYLANRGLPFVTAVLAAVLLGAAEFGQFITALSLFMAAVLFVDMGLSLATIATVARCIEADQVSKQKIVILAISICLAVGVAIGLVFYFSATVIAFYLLGDADMTALLVPGSLFIPSYAITAVANGALQGVQSYRALAISGAVGGMAYLAAVTLGTTTGNAEAAIWGAAFGALARAFCSLGAAGHRFRLWAPRTYMATSWEHQATRLLSVALPASVAAFAFVPVNTVLMALAYRSDDGAIEAAKLGIALQFFTVAMIAPGVLTQYALPKMASLPGAAAIRDRLAILQRFTRWALFIATLISLPVAAMSPWAHVVLGNDFRGIALPLTAMMIAALAAAPQGVVSNYLLATGRNWVRVLTRYSWGVIVLGFALLAPDKNALWLALAYALGWLTLIILQLFVVLRDHAQT